MKAIIYVLCGCMFYCGMEPPILVDPTLDWPSKEAVKLEPSKEQPKKK